MHETQSKVVSEAKQNDNEIPSLNKVAKYHKISTKNLTKQSCKISHNWHQNLT